MAVMPRIAVAVPAIAGFGAWVDISSYSEGGDVYLVGAIVAGHYRIQTAADPANPATSHDTLVAYALAAGASQRFQVRAAEWVRIETVVAGGGTAFFQGVL